MNFTDYSQLQQNLDNAYKMCVFLDGIKFFYPQQLFKCALPSELTFPGQGPSASTTATSLTSLLSSSFTTSASLTITNRPPSISSLTPSHTTSQTSRARGGRGYHEWAYYACVLSYGDLRKFHGILNLMVMNPLDFHVCRRKVWIIYNRVSRGIFFSACRTPKSPNTSSAPARTECSITVNTR